MRIHLEFRDIMANNSSQLSNTSANMMDMAEFVYYINTFGLPLIFLIGVVGNTVSFLVFVRTHLRFKSSSIYLAFMNVADTGMLLSSVPAWLGWLQIDVYNSQGWCQLSIYLTYVFSFLSVWVVVSFTIERYIVVFYPLLRNAICTLKKALNAMIGLTVMSFLLYSYSLWTTEVADHNGLPTCMSKEQYVHALRVLSGIDTVITLLIPSVALIILNGSIMWKLFLHRSTRESLGIPRSKTPIKCTVNDSLLKSHNTSPSHIDNNLYQANSKNDGTITPISNTSIRKTHAPGKFNTSLRRNNQMKTTHSLLIVSSVFLLLNLPSHAFRVILFLMQQLNTPPAISTYSLNVIQEICQLIYYINFAANFFLYVSSSICFREALSTLCPWCCIGINRLAGRGRAESNPGQAQSCVLAMQTVQTAYSTNTETINLSSKKYSEITKK